MVVNCLFIGNVEKIEKFDAIAYEEEQAEAEHGIRCQCWNRTVQDPHQEETTDPEENQLRQEEVEAMLRLLLHHLHSDVK